MGQSIRRSELACERRIRSPRFEVNRNDRIHQGASGHSVLVEVGPRRDFVSFNSTPYKALSFGDHPFTAIFFAGVSSHLGSFTVNTPCVYSAATSSGLTLHGSDIDRENEPLRRSMRW